MVRLDVEHLAGLNKADRPRAQPYNLLCRASGLAITTQPLTALAMQVQRLVCTHLLQNTLARCVVAVAGLRRAGSGRTSQPTGRGPPSKPAQVW